LKALQIVLMKFAAHIVLFCFLVSPAASLAQQADNHSISFYKIDNRVKVYVAEKLAYDSNLIDGNPDLATEINIERHLKKGLNSIKVELYNGSDMNDFIADTSWEIRYEIFNNGESIDYMHQVSKKGTEGLVFEYKHDIFKK